ncbi:MAG: SPOR domain-containing protein [Hyphomicrobiaceae bacterium]
MAKPASRKSGRSGGSSIFTGVLIGLVVGAVLAVGVALWATGVNPFKLGKHAKAPAKPAAPASATPETAPSFDFYKVLPDNSSNTLPSAAAPVASTAPQYYLQAGAFQRADEADNMKAQLALLGVEAVIQTSEVPNRGVLHRVRVGPFRAMDEVNRTRTLLTQNNIQVTLVKELPTKQETP